MTLVAIETEGIPLIAQDFGPGWGLPRRLRRQAVLGFGARRPWNGWRGRVELMVEFLVALLRAGAGSRLVAFADGSDTFWGGCTENQFLRAYLRIMRHSGAQIVFSAELLCQEQDCNGALPVPEWALGVARERGLDLEGDFWAGFERCDDTLDQSCVDRGVCGLRGMCTDPPALRFLNAGFVMGPAWRLLEMCEWVLGEWDAVNPDGDQEMFARYWIRNPGLVTLDYLAELSQSLAATKFNLWTLNKDDRVFENNAFRRVQCVLHANGPLGKDILWPLLRHLTDRPCWELRGLPEGPCSMW